MNQLSKLLSNSSGGQVSTQPTGPISEIVGGGNSMESKPNPYTGYTAPWYSKFKPPTPGELNPPKYFAANSIKGQQARGNPNVTKTQSFGLPRRTKSMGMF